MSVLRRMRWCAALLLAIAPGLARAETTAEKAAPCLACHGETGRSVLPEVPSLGGQPASFLLIQLYQFREKQRIAEPMNTLTAGFTDDDLRTMSEFLATLPAPKPEQRLDAAQAGEAEGIAAKHRCGFCHRADFSGQDQVPRIRAQREDYLSKALLEYRSGARTGYDPAMVEIAKGMNEAEIAAISRYLSRLD